MAEPNPLLSSHKSADGFQILLHPLVLLTISDYITRHTLRRQEGPVIGALLGQQNGNEITLEEVFECTPLNGEGGEVLLDLAKFEERLQQHRDVHKAPALDFVGWFTTTPSSGPQIAHVPLHRQLSQAYNESAVLLAFHPEAVAGKAAGGGKLPLTIYESVYEGDPGNAPAAQPIEADSVLNSQNLRFRELPYSVETGEAEMIGVDFVARGAGNAVVTNGSTNTEAASQGDSDVDGKCKAAEGANVEDTGTADLSPEDEELIASLTTRANAVKMLHSRILLLTTYLSNLPASYLTGDATSQPSTSEQAEINFPLLRSIQALVGRLSSLIPADKAAFERELLAEKNDVSLVTLMGSLTKSTKDIAEAGRKFQAIESSRHLTGKQRPNQAAAPSPQIADSFQPDMSLGGFGQRT